MSLENNRIKIDDLKEGSIVYVAYNQSGVGSFFRYPILRQELIKKITPKKTKIVTDYTEHDRYNSFYEINDETNFIINVVNSYNNIKDLGYEMRRFEIGKFKDDELIQLGELSKKIIEILKGGIE